MPSINQRFEEYDGNIRISAQNAGTYFYNKKRL